MKFAFRIAPLALCASFAMSLAACDKDEPAKPKTPPAAPEPISSDVVYNSFFDDKTKTPSSVVIADSGAGATPGTDPLGTTAKAKVLDAGAEPRARLSYSFALGKARTVTNTLKLDVQADAEGSGQQPPMKYTFTATPKTHNAGTNSTHFEMKINSLELIIPPGAQVPPQMAAQKSAMEKAFVGLTATFDANNQGDIEEIKFQDDKAPPQVAQLLELLAAAFDIMLVPLPAEPVGIGAKWQTVLTKPGKGSSSATVTLISKSETGASLKVENTVSAPPTAVPDPQLPPGTTVETKGSGSYTVDIRLDGVSSKAVGSQSVDRIIKVPASPQAPTGQSQKITVKMEQDLSSK